jgi:hypothetical protein
MHFLNEFVFGAVRDMLQHEIQHAGVIMCDVKAVLCAMFSSDAALIKTACRNESDCRRLATSLPPYAFSVLSEAHHIVKLAQAAPSPILDAAKSSDFLSRAFLLRQRMQADVNEACAARRLTSPPQVQLLSRLGHKAAGYVALTHANAAGLFDFVRETRGYVPTARATALRAAEKARAPARNGGSSSTGLAVLFDFHSKAFRDAAAVSDISGNIRTDGIGLRICVRVLRPVGDVKGDSASSADNPRTGPAAREAFLSGRCGLYDSDVLKDVGKEAGVRVFSDVESGTGMRTHASVSVTRDGIQRQLIVRGCDPGKLTLCVHPYSCAELLNVSCCRDNPVMLWHRVLRRACCYADRHT